MATWNIREKGEKSMEIRGLINKEFVNTVICKRPEDVHKGDCGKLLIVAGSKGMAGAAVLASRAAMKTGSGLVRVCIEEELFSIIQISVPEVICTTWSDIKTKTMQDLNSYDAIAVGPGMGDGERTKNILTDISNSYTGKLIIDADGLNVIAKFNLFEEVKNTKARVIISPHIGEARRLLKVDSRNDKNVDGKSKLTQMGIALPLTRALNAIVVVKGPGTLVAIDEKDAYTNTTGNPGMATAGSGDVLTGVIASLAGQGLSARDAARCGVFIHGMAGDLAASEIGVHGMTAGDIAAKLPQAIKSIVGK